MASARRSRWRNSRGAPRGRAAAASIGAPLAALLVAGGLIAAAGCEPLYTTWGPRESVPVWRARAPAPPPVSAPAELRVMTWNIKFGAARIDFFFDLWGDRVQMTHAEVMTNLENVAALIDEVDPDVLLVNEIEINSRRSAYVDMVRFLLERTRLGHAIYVPTWRSRYIASEGLGRMDMGNAIFSRYPIVRGERLRLSDRTDQDALTRAFYLHRAVGRAEIDLGGRRVAAFVVHTEAYDTDGTKSKQLREILDMLRNESLPLLIGGDFNAIPPGSLDVERFNDEHPDAIGTAFAQPPYRLDDMAPFYDAYRSAITLDDYGATPEAQRRHFTHSVIGRHQIGSRGEPGFWNRTLDYLFVAPPSDWAPGTADTLQEPGRLGIVADPMMLSDHCPVVGTWQVAP